MNVSRVLVTVLLALAATLAKGAPPPAGALIEMKMTSTVGVLLDEIPAGALRDEAAANALAKPASFWLARAREQVRLMGYRLVFRSSYYPEPRGRHPKTYGPLPLTPREVWNVALKGAPKRAKVGGRDLVVVDYTFGSVIVTDRASPGLVDPDLGAVGGTTSETFNLPIDPVLLFERTGYACMDEEEFPPGSVFEENTHYYYDDTCTSGATWCHVTTRPKASCVEALNAGPGRVRSTLAFTRLAYDPAIASAYRVGSVNPLAVAAGAAADLNVVVNDMANERAFAWRFFAPGSCELEEGAISRYGWRRVLAFSASVRNDGTAAIDLGDVSDPANPYVASHAFEYSPCHQHYHFSHYGTFRYAGGQGSKRAFCLEDTNRYHNDEATTLVATHQSCTQQGITAGWGDEYNFGIPGQWVDVTGIDTTIARPLEFRANPDEFLCEGTLVRDADGAIVFEPTAFWDGQNRVVYRAKCNKLANWDAGNLGSVNVASPGGSFVTEPCARGQMGPMRNCGFTAHAGATCNPGHDVKLACTAASPAVLRVCEVSGQEGTGVACPLSDALANVIVGPSATPVRFACPTVRDAAMSGDPVPVPLTVPGVGGYSLYRAALGTLGAADATPPAVTCVKG